MCSGESVTYVSERTKPPVVPCLYRQHGIFQSVYIRAIVAHSSLVFGACFWSLRPLPSPLPLCILRPTKMTSNDNNPGMTGDSSANQAPLPDETGGGGASASTATTTGAEGDNPPAEISLEQFQELQSKAAKADEN